MTRKPEHPNRLKTLQEKQQTLQEKQRDNRANQLNPNNERYWKARGLDKPPKPKPPHRRISG